MAETVLPEKTLPVSKKRGSKIRAKLETEAYFKWLLIIPLLLALVVFMLYPTFYCIFMGFTDYILRDAPNFVGFDNYRKILHDSVFWSAAGRTSLMVVTCIIVEITLGMSIAILLNREFKGQNVIRGLCFLPLLIMPLAMSMFWNYMLHAQFGIVNQILDWFGFDKILFFGKAKYALYTIMAIEIWRWLPFSIFVLLAGLKGLPKDQFEAANVDGASAWYKFRTLTLPMLKPLIIIIILLRTMWLIRTFDPLYGTTRAGNSTELLDWMVYRVSFVFFDIGQGSALAIFSLFVTIIICAILYRSLIKAMDQGH
ncbi:MAG: sugar ABC transporter permease [Nitrospina sp.]|jgi:multiple sugar transport system permease protein|nr:sugar ABC transporter permease [Nitrospina sp.]